jgi:hypothetical protein
MTVQADDCQPRKWRRGQHSAAAPVIRLVIPLALLGPQQRTGRTTHPSCRVAANPQARHGTSLLARRTVPPPPPGGRCRPAGDPAPSGSRCGRSPPLGLGPRHPPAPPGSRRPGPRPGGSSPRQGTAGGSGGSARAPAGTPSCRSGPRSRTRAAAHPGGPGYPIRRRQAPRWVPLRCGSSPSADLRRPRRTTLTGRRQPGPRHRPGRPGRGRVGATAPPPSPGSRRRCGPRSPRGWAGCGATAACGCWPSALGS